MKIEITGIRFNHTPGVINTGALSIRKNYTRAIMVPEWTPLTDGAAANAAYSIQDTTGNTITVQAKFTCDTPDTTVNIKATGGDALGTVAEQEVTLTDNYVSFSLTGTNLTSMGVNIFSTAWQWLYKLGEADWAPIGVTSFMIYTVLEEPAAPWSNSGDIYDTQLPWTDVLDVTNVWAKGATTTDQVQKIITAMVYNLGLTKVPVIEYDTQRGATNYAYPDFRCTMFLERLRGKQGLGSLVNCTDCATIVSSFTNIVGCRLWQSRMGFSFALRKLSAVGTGIWAVPFNGKFSYHEVAWKYPCNVNAEVYDACLELNTNRGTGAPEALLPVNMLYGDCNDLTDYRTYLTTSAPDGCSKCIPMADTAKRRQVS